MPRRPFFFRNLGLKILALAIALLVWFALSGQRRERISERSYRIPLSLVNVPPTIKCKRPICSRTRCKCTRLRCETPGIRIKSFRNC